MPEHIQNLLARLNEPGDNPLNGEELGELLTGLREEAQRIRSAPEGLTDEAVVQLQDIATAVAAVDTAATAIATAQAARETAAAEALAAIGEDPTADDETVADDETAPAGDRGTEPGSDAPPATETAPVPEQPAAPPATATETPAAAPAAEPALPIAAAATPPPRPTPGQAARRLAPAQSPARRADAPPATPTGPRAVATLIAAGGPTDATAGTTIESLDQVAEFTLNAYRRMGSPGRSMVASLVTEYPEELHLRRGRDEENSKKIEAVLSTAMVASGGICGPVAVDYTLPNWSTTDRPIKGGLPAFQADRGGLTFVKPTGLSTWNDGTAVWPETTDANPGTATKPVHVVVCGDTDTVYVDAVVTRLRFGNMQGRYFPEQVAYNTTQALAVAARDAETNLWDKIIAKATIAHAPQYLGATRDLLAYVSLAAVAVRDRGRMSEAQRMRVIIHRSFKEMLRVDLAREIGHNQSTEFNALAVTDQMIEDWLDARGVTPIWAIDSPTPVTKNSVAIVAQGFASQSAGAVLADWPASCAFTIFPEGGFQFLDGGRLDLGIVRDSILDATNDYESFIETFESVAFRSVEATTVVVPLVPNGASAGTVAPSEPAE